MTVWLVLYEDSFHFAFATEKAAEQYLRRRYGVGVPSGVRVAQEPVHRSAATAIKALRDL